MLGLLEKRVRWGFSRKGWICFIATSALIFICATMWIYPFFSVTKPVEADLLVVEGWVPDYAIRAAASEFKKGVYRKIITTGGPIRGMGSYVNDYNTAANLGAARLKALDLNSEQVQMAPSRVFQRDRTYASAVALRDWLAINCPSDSKINIITTDVHARRTRLLFQLALGGRFSVGIIAIPNPDYNSKHWWRYSEGVRDVMSEAIAYVYAKFFFYT